MKTKTKLFELGEIAVTAGVDQYIRSNPVGGIFIKLCLERHASGDWGEISADDKKANDSAVDGGGRIFSAYQNGWGHKFWIITEADRSSTTVMFPDEY